MAGILDFFLTPFRLGGYRPMGPESAPAAAMVPRGLPPIGADQMIPAGAGPLPAPPSWLVGEPVFKNKALPPMPGDFPAALDRRFLPAEGRAKIEPLDPMEPGPALRWPAPPPLAQGGAAPHLMTPRPPVLPGGPDSGMPMSWPAGVTPAVQPPVPPQRRPSQAMPPVPPPPALPPPMAARGGQPQPAAAPTMAPPRPPMPQVNLPPMDPALFAPRTLEQILAQPQIASRGPMPPRGAMPQQAGLPRLPGPPPGAGQQSALPTLPGMPGQARSFAPDGMPPVPAIQGPAGGGGLPALPAPGARPGTTTPIPNADGTVSTERSITVEAQGLNGGRPTNIPTIWNGRQVSEDDAVRLAIASGQAFPAFDTIEQATASARARSAAIGAGQPSVGGATLPSPEQAPAAPQMPGLPPQQAILAAMLANPVQVRNPQAPWRDQPLPQPPKGLYGDDGDVDMRSFLRTMGLAMMASGASGQGVIPSLGQAWGLADRDQQQRGRRQQEIRRLQYKDTLEREKAARDDWRAGQTAAQNEARFNLDQRKLALETIQKIQDAEDRAENNRLNREQRQEAARQAAELRADLARMQAGTTMAIAQMTQAGRTADREQRAYDAEQGRENQNEITYRSIYDKIAQPGLDGTVSPQAMEQAQVAAIMAAPNSRPARAAIERAPAPPIKDGTLDMAKMKRGIYRDPRRGAFYWDGVSIVPLGTGAGGAAMPSPESATGRSIVPQFSQAFARPFAPAYAAAP